MAERRHGTVHAEQRIRALLAELGPEVHNLGSELVHNDAFRSQEWPRGVYALDRTDMEAVLALLDQARSLRIVPRSLEPLIDPAVHSPGRLRAYLAARGWVLHEQYPEASHWRHDTKIRRGWDADHSLVLVLDSTRFSDYAQRIAETAVDMADFEGVGELQVLADIAASEPEVPDV